MWPKTYSSARRPSVDACLTKMAMIVLLKSYRYFVHSTGRGHRCVDCGQTGTESVLQHKLSPCSEWPMATERMWKTVLKNTEYSCEYHPHIKHSTWVGLFQVNLICTPNWTSLHYHYLWPALFLYCFTPLVKFNPVPYVRWPKDTGLLLWQEDEEEHRHTKQLVRLVRNYPAINTRAWPIWKLCHHWYWYWEGKANADDIGWNFLSFILLQESK